MESKVFLKLQILAAISKVGTVWKETEPSSNQIVITDFDLQSIPTFPASQDPAKLLSWEMMSRQAELSMRPPPAQTN